MQSPLAEVSGYTDEVPADSGPTIPRSKKSPDVPQRLQDTDEVPTVTAPQTPLAVSSSVRRTSGEELTLTGTAQPTAGARMPEGPRLFIPPSLESNHEVTESAIFVAPRARAETPPERTPTPPPRPAMASFPDRPLLPSTPQAGVPQASVRWPPLPPSQAPFVPPPAFKTQATAAARGEHAAMSTTSLRAVFFPQDRSRRIAVVSVVGCVGGAILLVVFFAIWRVASSPVAQAPSVSPPPETAKPLVLTAPPSTGTQAITTASASPLAPTIPTLDLQQPSPQPTHHHGARQPSTVTTATAVTSSKTGYLTVMCKPNACDHVIDGARDLGGSPIFKQEVAVGRHMLTLHVDGTHSQKTVPVDVREGETATIHPDTSQ